MSTTTTLPSFPLFADRSAGDDVSASASVGAALETQKSRFALRVTARLTESADALSPDIGERLRFAREKALERARAVRTAETEHPVGLTAAGAGLRARLGSRLWVRLGSVLPVVALVGGLLLIEHWQDNDQISVAAEIDAALLSDELPPTAYSDAGFAEFLKTPSEATARQ